jgi:hypothetical protein
MDTTHRRHRHALLNSTSSAVQKGRVTTAAWRWSVLDGWNLLLWPWEGRAMAAAAAASAGLAVGQSPARSLLHHTKTAQLSLFLSLSPSQDTLQIPRSLPHHPLHVCPVHCINLGLPGHYTAGWLRPEHCPVLCCVFVSHSNTLTGGNLIQLRETAT